MKYQGNAGFTHRQPDKIGVLLTNLGTPQAPTKQALKPYLRQFLSDPRVVEVPKIIWQMILNLVILNIRPARSAEAYQTVWTDRGSPLLFHTLDQRQKLADVLKAELSEEAAENLVVEMAMRYGSPSISSVIDNMLAQGVRKLVVLPLYPHYSGSTIGSTFDAIAEDFTKRRWLPELRFINGYCDNPDYISAIADSVRTFQAENGQPDKLIFSYHGVPKRYLTNGDPYHCQCYKTSRLVAAQLGLQPEQYLTTFQSRFGREEWLKPYTDHTLKALPGEGIKSVQMICPGFASDCLETIEEIGEENREYFMEAGGETYQYIPCLNATEPHIQVLKNIVLNNLHGWDVDTASDSAVRNNEYEALKQQQAR